MRLVLNPDHEYYMGYHFMPVGNSIMLNTVGGDDLVVLLEDYIVEEGS